MGHECGIARETGLREQDEGIGQDLDKAPGAASSALPGARCRDHAVTMVDAWVVRWGRALLRNDALTQASSR